MKFLNAKELSKLVVDEGKGRDLHCYGFKKISNSPSLAVRQGEIIRCTCKAHSIYTTKQKDCRFTNALNKYLEQNEYQK